jgi:hypothetical protein
MDFSPLKAVKNSVANLNPLEKFPAPLPDLPSEALENLLASFASAFTQATVTGPEGEEVYTDEMGRVKDAYP